MNDAIHILEWANKSGRFIIKEKKAFAKQAGPACIDTENHLGSVYIKKAQNRLFISDSITQVKRGENTMDNMFAKRIELAETAISHGEPERIPIWINYGSTPYVTDEETDSSYKDVFYDHEKAKKAIIRFHEEFQPDIALANLHSGPAEELAGTKYIDWPGRPGTRVADTSIFQVHEYEFMEQDEYSEMLGNFTGFMLHKYLPRAFTGLNGLSKVLAPAPTGYMNFTNMTALFNTDALDAFEKLLKIGKLEQKNQEELNALQIELGKKGFPPMFTGVGLVPYDILANYFRGTLGIFDDLIEVPEMVQAAVDFMTELQIANLQYFRFAQLPVKRCMFWMHKGVDGFMSPDQFEKLYWTPFLKVIYALVDMGVTPIIYTEGNYTSRLPQMTDLPKNQCVIHFENVDLKTAKDTIGKHNCITGNFPIYLLEYGTVDKVVDEAKRQIDIGAPEGGFIFETNASIEVVKRENLMALYDTVRTYGAK